MIKRKKKHLEELEEYGKKMGKLEEEACKRGAERSKRMDEMSEEACERGAEMSKRMDEMREEACKRSEEAREELWKETGVTKTPKQRDGITKRTEDVKGGKKENGE